MANKRYGVGTDGPPAAPFQHGVCRGTVDPSLRGKGALLSFDYQNRCVVQFDDPTTGYGFGWHAWDARDFDIRPPGTGARHDPVPQDGGPMHAAMLGKTKLDNY